MQTFMYPHQSIEDSDQEDKDDYHRLERKINELQEQLDSINQVMDEYFKYELTLARLRSGKTINTVDTVDKKDE